MKLLGRDEEHAWEMFVCSALAGGKQLAQAIKDADIAIAERRGRHETEEEHTARRERERLAGSSG